MASAARLQTIDGGSGSGAPINKNRLRRTALIEIVGCGDSSWSAHGSNINIRNELIDICMLACT